MEEDAKGGQEQVQQEMQMVKDMLDELNGEKQELETEVSLFVRSVSKVPGPIP